MSRRRRLHAMIFAADASWPLSRHKLFCAISLQNDDIYDRCRDDDDDDIDIACDYRSPRALFHFKLFAFSTLYMTSLINDILT